MLQDSSRLVGQIAVALSGSFLAVALTACGGGGGGGNPPPTTGNVTISGRITFDRVPFKTALSTGLNPASPVASPARNVVVEAVSSNGSVLTTTSTDANGDYSVSVPAGTQLFIRAKAQMVKTGTAPTFSFSVRNNTNSDALFALDGSTSSSGNGNSTRNLNAPSGWNGTAFVDTQRAAAPFAILDTVYRAKELIVAAQSGVALPALDLYWSTSNRPTSGTFCTNTGDIGTTFYIGAGAPDGCAGSSATVPPGIYILGATSGSGDTDEFDAHVIAHEFGHYVEDNLSRSDSMGGEHGFDELLDLRLAFSEGWGNGFSGMVQNDPVYRDSQSIVASDFNFNMENVALADPGWYAELSVAKVLWDIFDATPDGADNVALGFGPIYTAMLALANTDAMTSIFPMAASLRSANAGSAAGITSILNSERIFGTDAFGAGETNNAGVAALLPVYDTIALNTPKVVCTTAPFGNTDGNKLGNNRLLRFDNSAQRQVVIQATGVAQGGGTAATDPDIYVYRRGTIVASGEGTNPGSETIPAFSMAAGTHIIEVLDFDLGNAQTHCMNLSIQG